MQTARRLSPSWGVLAWVAVAGCVDQQPTTLEGVQQIIYIQRTPSETGNVFDYTKGGSATDQADIYLLAPPTASGTRTNLTNLGAGSDVQAMDLSFDANEIVFSARVTGKDRYHIFRINVDGTNPCEAGKKGYCQISDGPNDEVYPVYLPGDRIFFMTNANVEGTMVKQFRDEYERATTAQVATMSKTGGDVQLGARNVSHRVSPTLLADGRMMMTQWDHLGEVNEGNLVLMNQDLTGNREGFGKEGNGVTNAYLRAREVAPGQVVTIGTSRDRTFQSGKILLVNLGTLDASGKVIASTMSEHNARAIDLTPDVPGGREPSSNGVGRYYDAAPIGDPANRKFLVSWADGPVESSTLAMAGIKPSFGVYVFDGKKNTRFPLVVVKDKWIVSPLAVAKRATPTALPSSNMASGTTSTLISALNLYDSSLFQIEPGSIKKVRLMEGFSDEEGVPGDFGLTEFDGHALLGEIDPAGDGSFKAVVPANVPIHIQLLDQFAMAASTKDGKIASEPIWIQGRAGEARTCGGCHEDRTKTPQIQPGSLALQALGAAKLDLPRAQRASTDYSPAKVKGVPWDKALQPIFDRACADCHDGTMNGANKSYTVMDNTDMSTFTFTFDLRGQVVNVTVGNMMYAYTASHIALMGPSMMFREKNVSFLNGVMPKIHVQPGAARDSNVIKMLNPPLRYPTVDMNTRAFGAAPQHPAEVTTAINGHSGSDPKYKLTGDEQYLLILMADMGGQFYSRENAPGGNY